jgi:HTH-type transcriptional regulator/antitoxin HipB
VAATSTVIGQNIREARRARAWTQKELALKVGVESQTISNLERGVYQPSWKTLHSLAEALELSLEELLSENGAAAA